MSELFERFNELTLIYISDKRDERTEIAKLQMEYVEVWERYEKYWKKYDMLRAYHFDRVNQLEGEIAVWEHEKENESVLMLNIQKTVEVDMKKLDEWGTEGWRLYREEFEVTGKLNFKILELESEVAKWT